MSIILINVFDRFKHPDCNLIFVDIIKFIMHQGENCIVLYFIRKHSVFILLLNYC